LSANHHRSGDSRPSALAGPPREAVIDGALDDPDWARAIPIVRTQAWRGDGTATIRMLHSAQGLYLSAQVADHDLWADGNGHGNDPAGRSRRRLAIFYVDPDESRDEYFQPSDRGFGVNLGNPEDSLHGTGRVRRCKYVQGDGALDAPDVRACGDPVSDFLAATGIQWATRLDGTVNEPSDVDRGWTTEMFSRGRRSI
jgi:hypothetical protein